MPRVMRDVRHWDKSFLILRDGFAINSHVGVIRERRNADNATLLRNDASAQFVFEVLCVNLPRPPHQIDSIRNLRHQPLAKTDPPMSVLEFGDEAYRISACFGGVIVSTGIVYRPVRKREERI